MNTLRCPGMDRLGRNLIDAYRDMDNADVFGLASGMTPETNRVSQIHREMAEHRRNCPICLRNNLPPVPIKSDNRINASLDEPLSSV